MEPNTQRWTAGKKTELVVSILKQEKTLVDACRENDLLRSCLVTRYLSLLSHATRDFHDQHFTTTQLLP